MQMLLSTHDNLLFAIDALAYNILNIITKNSLIYGFIILYVKSQESQSSMIYIVLSFAATILMNLLFTHLYIPLIYKKHKNYIISKVSVYIRDMYMHALIDKYLTQKSMKNIYEIFSSFTQYIDNYWSLYEMHAEIIVASIIIAIAYNSNSVNKIILIISSAILIILFILDNVLLDQFNDLHEYFITSILNEKLLLIFLIYVPYTFVNNKNINPNILTKSTNNIYGSLMAIFIILFWKISFNNFLNKYSNKIDLTHKIKEFIIAEQQQELPTEINELSNKHNHFIYLIHDSNEPISIIDYFRLTNPNISKSQIIKTLDKLSILPELQKKLNTKMNDTSLTDEQKIKISIARSLIIPQNYTVIYFQDDQIVNKYLKIISNHKIPITGNPHAS